MSDARLIFERLALGLIVHGPEAATLRLTRRLGRSALWLETRSLLRQHGFVDSEIGYLIGRHPAGCACWDCVRGLNRAVRRSVRKATLRQSTAR